MNQVLLGLSIPFAIGVVVYAVRGLRASMRMLTVVPILMGLSALWAVAPDIPRVLGMHSLYSRLARDPRMNIFYWHYSIDLMETDSRWFSVIFVVVIAGMLAASYRELRLMESRGGDE